MHQYSPSHRPTYSLAALTQEFITERGWTQCDIADKMRKLQASMPPDQNGMVRPVSNSCLSRWKVAEGKPVLRRQFIAVAYASAHLDWEFSGKSGPEPGLSDVLDLWEHRHTSSPFRADAISTRWPGTPPILDGKPYRRPESALSDATQIRARRSYGTAGVNLLDAARAGDRMAALDFGLLRTLDGHRREGEEWVRTAYFKNHSATNSAGGRITVEYDTSLPTVAQAALERASELPANESHQERRALLLEKAATHKTPHAAGLLAAYFEGKGETGAAARWRTAIN